MNGAAMLLTRAIIDAVPTARWRTGVWNNSAVYMKIPEKVIVTAPLPKVERAVIAPVWAEVQS